MTSPWHTILSQAGISFSADGKPEFTESAQPPSLQVIPLIDRGVLQLNGEGSKKFLQGQATCNLDELTRDNWLTGAICDPKGRMITSFSLYQAPDEQLLMEMHRGLVETTLQAIQKYSVFFKTSLVNAGDQFAIIGLIGPDAPAAVEQLLPEKPKDYPGVIHHKGLLAATLADKRIKLVIPVGLLPDTWQRLTRIGKGASPDVWALADIQQGIGDITPQISGELIPQMTNLQARGGISFKKGCYTGQEIVARMKYLGKLKRRMYRVALQNDLVPAPGEPCFGSEGTGNQGVVVQAVKAGGHTEALIVMTGQLAGSSEIKIGQYPATTFRVLPLPYSLD